METIWFTVFGVLAGLAVVQSLLILLQTWEHRRFARNRLCQLYRYWPLGRAMVYAPCKGHDIDLEDNLRQVLTQDYGNYEVTFVVESTSDPAYPLIRRLMAEYPRVTTHLVVAGLAEGCGQKVHNLRVATAEVPAQFAYVAFVDSDARVRRQWLRALVSHLDSPRAGVATGYRWFVPTRASFVQNALYSINSNVAVLLRSRSPNLVWGGSWAMRREVFQRLKIRDALDGMLTEDLVVADRVQRHGMRVEFEPACVAVSPIEGGFAPLFSFLRRQYMLGRFYVPSWWRLGFLTLVYANLVLGAAVPMLCWGLALRSPLAWIPATALVLLYLVHVLRGVLRQGLIGVYCPEQRRRLARARWFDIWAGPLVSAASLVVLVSSRVGSVTTWRGITYRLARGGKTQILRRAESGSPASEPDEEPATLGGLATSSAAPSRRKAA